MCAEDPVEERDGMEKSYWSSELLTSSEYVYVVIYTVFERITEGMLTQVSWEADKKRLDGNFYWKKSYKGEQWDGSGQEKHQTMM